MITTVVCFLLVLFFARGLVFETDYDYQENKSVRHVCGYGILFLVLLAIMGGLMGGLAGSLLLPTEKVPNELIRLETMYVSGPDIEGNFFLGSGHISSDEYYKYQYYEGRHLRDGKVIRYDDSKALVYLDRDQEAGTAYLITYHPEWTWPYSHLFGIKPLSPGPKIYEFHIPFDAIVPNIDIQ